MNPHRRETDIRLSESKLVEDLIAAANLLGKNAHPYYEGRKMRVGCRLSEYRLPDGARVEMRKSPSAYVDSSFILSFNPKIKGSKGSR
jgi:hypothetical protein